MKKMRKVFSYISFTVILAMLLFVLTSGTTTMSSVDAASIKISKKELTLAKGQKYTLKVTGTKKKVSWKSSDKNIVTVSSGKLQAKKEGTVKITAKVGTKKLTCKVTVKGNYKTLYKSFLEQYTFTVDKDYKWPIEAKSFCILDIDKNGVPELIIKNGLENDSMCVRYVFTVKGGKVHFCGEYGQKGESDLRYSPKHKALNRWWWTNGVGGVGSMLLQLSGGKLKEYRYVYSGAESYGSSKIKYWYGYSSAKAKKVSKSTYQSKFNKYFKDLKVYKFMNNTEENRTKIFG